MLTQANEQIIRQFFDRSFIEVQNVTRRIGESARQLLWSHEHLKYKDAIHVATALVSNVDALHTYDNDLLRLDGQYGAPRLTIVQPPAPQPSPPPETDLFNFRHEAR
jgi:predicted nucleic acid-binding protein